MNQGDISVFVDSVGGKHVGVVCAVNPDATVDICVLKPSQRGIKLTATGEPGTFFDPTMPIDSPEVPVDQPTKLVSIPEEDPNAVTGEGDAPQGPVA